MSPSLWVVAEPFCCQRSAAQPQTDSARGLDCEGVRRVEAADTSALEQPLMASVVRSGKAGFRCAWTFPLELSNAGNSRALVRFQPRFKLALWSTLRVGIVCVPVRSGSSAALPAAATFLFYMHTSPSTSCTFARGRRMRTSPGSIMSCGILGGLGTRNSPDHIWQIWQSSSRRAPSATHTAVSSIG